MADVKEAVKKVYELEFNNPKNALHVNKGEQGYTYMGIYQKAHPTWPGWRKVDAVLIRNFGDVAKASVELYNDSSVQVLVDLFYENKFWLPIKLDQIKSQKVAEEIFVFAVNAGFKAAIKAAQRCAGAVDDGIIGPKTIKALNEVDEYQFSVEYDQEEVCYYEELVKRNPRFKRFLNGWRNRAYAV
jgi:lysozyme family protein